MGNGAVDNGAAIHPEAAAAGDLDTAAVYIHGSRGPAVLDGSAGHHKAACVDVHAAAGIGGAVQDGSAGHMEGAQHIDAAPHGKLGPGTPGGFLLGLRPGSTGNGTGAERGVKGAVLHGQGSAALHGDDAALPSAGEGVAVEFNGHFRPRGDRQIQLLQG